MSAYTMGQKAKAIVATIGALVTLVLPVAVYIASSDLVSDDVAKWAGFVVGVLTVAATGIATFKKQNATTTDGWRPADDAEVTGTQTVEQPAQIEGTH